MPDFAERVVVDVDAHTFDVDGEKFPWYVSPDGPTVRRLRDDLYEVSVTIFVIDKFTSPGNIQGSSTYPVIDGREFPWYITADGVKFTRAGADPAMVELAFLAKHVEAEGIADDRALIELGEQLDG